MFYLLSSTDLCVEESTFLSRVSMPMHAKRDIVMANLSVVVLHTLLLAYCIETNSRIVKLLPPSGRSVTLSFSIPPPLQNSKGNSLSGSVKYKGQMLQISPFISKNSRLYEVGPWLLWNTNRKWMASDSFRPWRYINLLAYLFTYLGSHRSPIDPCRFQ